VRKAAVVPQAKAVAANACGQPQRKLAIGASNDPLQREADRIVGAALPTPRNAAPANADHTLRSAGRTLEPSLQHDMEPRFGHDFSKVRVHSGTGVAGESPAMGAALRTPGEALDSATRSAMEARFAHAIGSAPWPAGGLRADEYERQADEVAQTVSASTASSVAVDGPAIDFSDVRVHTGAAASQAVDGAGALAFAAGRHIVFGPGQYAPNSAAGGRLLAHELTHVLQQQHMGSAKVQWACRAPRGYTAADFSRGPIADQIRRELARPQFTPPPARRGERAVPRFAPGEVIDSLASSNCFLENAQTIQNRYYDREGRPRSGVTPLRIRLHEEPETGNRFVREAAVHRVEVEVGSATAMQALIRGIVHELVHASHRPAAAGPARGPVAAAEQTEISEETGTRTRENEVMAEIGAARGWTLPATPATSAEVRASLRSGLPRLTYQEYAIIDEMKRRNRVAGLDEGAAVAAARRMVATRGVPAVDRGEAAEFRFGASQLQLHRERAGGEHRVPAGPYTEMRIEMQRRQTEASTAFVAWYNGLGQTVHADAHTASFFQWVLIAESMSAEWLRIGHADPLVRRRHFEFLREIMGRPLLRGVPEPPAPTPPTRPSR